MTIVKARKTSIAARREQWVRWQLVTLVPWDTPPTPAVR
jgi:hypothetical protein